MKTLDHNTSIYFPPHLIDPRSERVQRDRKEGKRERRATRLARIAQKRSWLLH
ncbi:hypothetical protein [Maritalea porphyrae]|uniref:hypothetical protein n=1 Tax=Maritalea porphyrae TaxID=880732 RepID=UPI0022AE871F|nr:hypothetical protein [Maritalea porphyrae]MCZ4270737.1 hypothetical protein [Maritalea porphyrae]